MNKPSDSMTSLTNELANRIDQLKAEGHIDDHAEVCLSGILEGMASICHMDTKQ